MKSYEEYTEEEQELFSEESQDLIMRIWKFKEKWPTFNCIQKICSGKIITATFDIKDQPND